jgi:hypothetical protein
MGVVSRTSPPLLVLIAGYARLPRLVQSYRRARTMFVQRNIAARD